MLRLFYICICVKAILFPGEHKHLSPIPFCFEKKEVMQ
jgi:hypothetical protein